MKRKLINQQAFQPKPLKKIKLKRTFASSLVHNAPMNVVILDDYQDSVRKLQCATKLAFFNTKIYTNNVKGIGQLVLRLKDADAVVIIRERTAITSQILDKLPRLRLIVQTGQLGRSIDVAACQKRGVAVVAGQPRPEAAAEFIWALLMATSRRLPQYMANLRHGVWQQSGLKSSTMPPNFGLGRRLHGKKLGLWGFGQVGALIANYANAFGMNVMVWGSEQTRDTAAEIGHNIAESREQILTESDFLSLHLKATTANQGSILLSDLMKMKPTSILINTSSHSLFQHGALVSALNQGHPGMAAVDVFDVEPVMRGNSLIRLENCLCTPHIAHLDLESYEEDFSAAFDVLHDFAKGSPIPTVTTDDQQL